MSFLRSLFSPFTDDDLKYPAKVFGYESYLGQYGLRISKPQGDVVIWANPTDVKQHPNVIWPRVVECF